MLLACEPARFSGVVAVAATFCLNVSEAIEAKPEKKGKLLRENTLNASILKKKMRERNIRE